MNVILEKGDYSLQDENGKELGRLIKGWGFLKQIRTYIKMGDVEIDFKDDGFFSPRKVCINGQEIGDVKLGFNSNSVDFNLYLDGRIHKLKVRRRKGISFKLIDEFDEEVMVFIPRFKWWIIKIGYQVYFNTKHSLSTSKLIILLALYGIYRLSDVDTASGD